MKTTIDIADPLMKQARQLAAEQGTTVRALVESGLRKVINEQTRAPTFQLRDASVDGLGLQPELEGAGWSRIIELSCEGRGA